MQAPGWKSSISKCVCVRCNSNLQPKLCLYACQDANTNNHFTEIHLWLSSYVEWKNLIHINNKILGKSYMIQLHFPSCSNWLYHSYVFRFWIYIIKVVLIRWNNVKPCFTNNNPFACECKILNVLLVLSCQEAGLGQNLPKIVFSLTPVRKWRSASEFLSKPGVSRKIYMQCQYKSWNINNQFRINIVILNSLKSFTN